MREEILEKAGELFFKIGYKSVTMDDIASEMGISKKTIYKFFKNKEVLIEESVNLMHEACHQVIDTITSQGHNPIKENFEIKKMFKEMFQNADTSPIYQLKKYYPKIYDRVMTKEMVVFHDCIKSNIERGIEQGFYRDNIDINNTVKFYFALVFYIHENMPMNEVQIIEIQALEYHTRAIATNKGIDELNKHLNN
ncbi:TetR/AcrR family transcriptional regulator [Pseudofulvibacter geojedonensis]